MDHIEMDDYTEIENHLVIVLEDDHDEDNPSFQVCLKVNPNDWYDVLTFDNRPEAESFACDVKRGIIQAYLEGYSKAMGKVRGHLNKMDLEGM